MIGFLFDFAWGIFAYVAGVIGIVAVLTYGLVQLLQLAFKPQNLKLKYNASWALVTGASSGIGKSLVERLAEQGLNVVMVALDDKILADSFVELQKKYTKVELRKVGVNLGGDEATYMGPIIKATDDIEVTLVFNNAGFILPGFFAESSKERMVANYNCNATAAVHITHHFLRRIMQSKRRGLVTFTSSAAAYFPGPTAALYAGTKAFLTSFAVSIAGELRDCGIDVVVVHPSPIQSNFYRGTSDKMTSLQAAQKAASSPFVIADALLSAPGRLVVWDQGSTCAIFRMVMKTFDFAFFNEVTSRLACHFNPDHKTLAKASDLRK